MADPVYPIARFQLHKDTWGTATAGLKGTTNTDGGPLYQNDP